MTAELDPPMSGGGRARRPRRAVITDDSYGDEGYLERDGDGAPPAPRAAAAPAIAKSREAATRTKKQPRSAERAPRQSGGEGRVAWRLAALATLMWLGGVGAFATGFFQLPTQSLQVLWQATLMLPPHLLLMTGAIAAAPLGLIWLTALSARRAGALRAETQALAARLGGASGSDSSANAGQAIGDLETSLAAVEERAEIAVSKLQSEREALQRLIEDLENGQGRFADAIAENRDAGARPRPRQAGSAGRNSERNPDRLLDRGQERGLDRSSDRPDSKRGDDRDTVGLEPASMLAGSSSPRRSPPVEAPLSNDVSIDDDFDDENEEYTPALSPERASPSEPPARVKISEYSRGNGRARAQLEEINQLKARVEGGRSNAAVEPKPAGSAPPLRQSGPTLDWVKLIAAANFPESEDDQATLDALYAVLTDSETAALLQAAEDALSGLAEIGLFMEDMQPHHAPAELWRAFIVDGKRNDVMDLGGIRDPHAIEDASEALRTKSDFADICARFLERYESMSERLFSDAPDPAMVVELADTRTGRAYMLLARASGRFG